MAKFNIDDAYNFESLLSEDDRMIMETAREYARTKLEPRAMEGNQQEIFHPEIPAEMAELGLLGVTIDPQYGGVGASYTAYGLITREIERVDSAYRSFMSVQSSLVMHPINEFGTEEQKKRFLPRLATAEIIGCFGLTEPDHGSDPGSMVTTAVKVDGGWVLNGAKMWITNSPVADIAIVWAKAKEHKDDKPVIRGFIVEKEFKGYSAPVTHNKMSLRASHTGEIILEDCFVPDENAFPDIRGLKGPFSCLNSARYGIAWGTVGAAANCYHTTRTVTPLEALSIRLLRWQAHIQLVHDQTWPICANQTVYWDAVRLVHLSDRLYRQRRSFIACPMIPGKTHHNARGF